jgi:hypothetical protein
MILKPKNAHNYMKDYYKHCTGQPPLYTVYNTLSYTYVHFLVLISYLIAQ